MLLRAADIVSSRIKDVVQSRTLVLSPPMGRIRLNDKLIYFGQTSGMDLVYTLHENNLLD